ncbi:phosphoribosylaminoimidazolesuccinocarboxamide synthase [Bifidobacterium pullorum]|uniref:phosphoribosylaminoimidazolesuccinocarboxamide synthase n=1 Tax=Bifidobacterium pullorum TaxID=78448 RepID=UPI003F26BB87
MEKLEKLYEGKAKKLYATDDPDVLWVEYMNQATAGNGEKKAQIEGKGSLNNRITSVIFDLLKARGVDSHFVRRISETEQLVKKMDMYPLEIIMRNTAAGSFAKRYGVEEGTELKKPILEFCLKSDALGDPFINEDGIVALGLADEDEIAEISRQARAVNTALLDIFAKIDVKLVDFKIEEGKTSDGAILLADEITPDTCRLWDQKDHSGKIEHLDKDLFRRDLGNIIPAYEEIYDRLMALAATEGVDSAE